LSIDAPIVYSNKASAASICSIAKEVEHAQRFSADNTQNVAKNADGQPITFGQLFDEEPSMVRDNHHKFLDKLYLKNVDTAITTIATGDVFVSKINWVDFGGELVRVMGGNGGGGGGCNADGDTIDWMEGIDVGLVVTGVDTVEMRGGGRYDLQGRKVTEVSFAPVS
jgi:hypothetical protein